MDHQEQRHFVLTRRPDVARTAIAWNGIVGFLLPPELNVLYQAGLTAAPGARFLEVGSFFGLSSTLVATGFKDAGNTSAHLDCIDLWEEYYGASKERFLNNCESAGVMEWITPHQDSSRNVQSLFAPNSFDLVFVDGDHSYEGCLNDLIDTFPLVKSGGRILGPDYAGYSLPVIQAVRDFIERTPGAVFEAPSAGSSIFTIHIA